MIKRSSIVFLLLLVCWTFADDTKKEQLDTVQSSAGADSIKRTGYNPSVAGGLSLIVPGAGQFYSRHYVKGSAFLLFEGVTIGTAIYWFNNERDYHKSTKTLFEKAFADTGSKKIKYQGDAELSEFDERRAKYRGYNAVAWASGLYVYSFLDAIEGARIVDKTGGRSPVRAGLLSAIPGLGLGQLYNGAISKAGMIFMGQMALGVVSANYHRLMTKAEREYLKIENDSAMVDAGYLTKWESERTSAFKYRNTYLWYSIFYYFYGIFDAVVDAHLHDYNDKMRLYPDLAPQGDGAALKLDVRF